MSGKGRWQDKASYSTSQELCTQFTICYALFWFSDVQFYPHCLGLFHWHWGNHMIAPVPVNRPWTIWVYQLHGSQGTDNTTTAKHSTRNREHNLWYVCDEQQSIWHIYWKVTWGSALLHRVNNAVMFIMRLHLHGDIIMVTGHYLA